MLNVWRGRGRREINLSRNGKDIEVICFISDPFHFAEPSSPIVPPVFLFHAEQIATVADSIDVHLFLFLFSSLLFYLFFLKTVNSYTRDVPAVAVFIIHKHVCHRSHDGRTDYVLTLIHHSNPFSIFHKYNNIKLLTAHTGDKLFINETEINTSNWKWGANLCTLTWNQGKLAGIF